jgi:hypothetical protein
MEILKESCHAWRAGGRSIGMAAVGVENLERRPRTKQTEFRDETTITASHESKVGSKDIQSLEETKEEVVALPGDMTVGQGWGKITETMGDTPGDYQVDLLEVMSVGGLVATTESMSEGVLVEGVPLPEPVRRKCTIM